jgi:uncharacterized protein (DUF2236 family)
MPPERRSNIEFRRVAGIDTVTAVESVRPKPRLGARLARPLFDAADDACIDYGAPKGDPGLFGPGSMAWKVHANPVALAIGGVAAVILELAEPRVRTGVWEHSIFKTDPLKRMRRTGEATLITTYGPTQAAERRVAMVTRMHERVFGVTPEGQAYSALEPELMTWVHITAGWGFLNAYDRYVEPVSRADKDRYYAEGAALGRAFGADAAPGSAAEVDQWFQRMNPKLKPHPIIGEFLDIVAATSPIGPVGRLVQPLVVQAAIDLLPPPLQTRLALPLSQILLAAARPTLRLMAKVAANAPSQEVVKSYERMNPALA